MVFCNKTDDYLNGHQIIVTILILIDGFLQFGGDTMKIILLAVTILILIDGFLQSCCATEKGVYYNGHNPYFNRWFSAIWK